MAKVQKTGLFFMSSANQAGAKEFPEQFKGKLLKQLDVGFLIILFACAIVCGSTFVVLSLRPLPKEMTEKEILKIQERYAQLVLNQPKKKVEEAVKKVETAQAEAKTEEKEEEKPKIDRKKESVVEKKQRKEKSRETRKQKRAAIKQQLQASGIFAAITSSGTGGTSSSTSVTDLLGSASSAMGDVGDIDISKGSFATKNIDPDVLLKRRGEKTTGVDIEKENVGRVQGTQIATSGNINITTAPPEIKSESGNTGNRTQASIGKVMNRYIPRFKKVYESMLKRDPNLSGKIQIKFTIMPDGTVANVIILQSTTNNSTFDKRIASYLKRIKFPSDPSADPTEVVYPFVFTGST